MGVGEQEGKDHADSTQPLVGRPRVGLRDPRPGADVNISGLPARLQAQPERARLRQALQSQPRQGPSRGNSGCLGRSRWEPQSTRAAGPPGPSPPPQAPRVSRPLLPTSRGPGDVTAALTRANGGTGVLRGGPGSCSPLPRPWPSSRGTSIFQIREGRLSFGYW